MTIAIFLGALMGAMALGIPIAFSLLLCGAALMWHMNMFDAQILAQNVIEGRNSFPLLAVPFFMLAGEIMNAGGLSRRIVKFAMALVGHVRGGLGYVGIMAAIIMAALSGSGGRRRCCPGRAAVAHDEPRWLQPRPLRRSAVGGQHHCPDHSRPALALWCLAWRPTCRCPSCSWPALHRASCSARHCG